MRNLLRILIAVSILYQCSCISLGREQSSGAKGVLTCNGKPLAGVRVKLFDDDRGIDADDLLDDTKTNERGEFSLSGSTSEITTIDPKINIYHDCEDGIRPCQRKMTIFIPDAYVNTGPRPKKFYEAGTIELAGKFPGEERDCLH
ncbi:unnamed protein product [Bursaphelenchus xylophilus]|uniref:(pine wood nematode) hypothetical protein n=1 Tax=Bursaphelenchus xylophilus TaxID=6326 RepID=A0A1I7SQX3_BURXY|nr:unnamed protein product [Bursaphelenchus xylophilus]CAG9110512.1 unnamed protein product [Bursaphelenchus xylophilus]